MKKTVAKISVGTMYSLLGVLTFQKLTEPEPGPTCIPVEFDYGEICDLPKFNEVVRSASEDFGVDSDLLVAHIVRESSCRPWVTGDKGRSLGLAQVQPRWWAAKLRREGILEEDQDLYDTGVAVRSLAFISAENKKFSKSLHESVRRYNGKGPKAEAYADKVLTSLMEIRSRREGVEISCERS